MDELVCPKCHKNDISSNPNFSGYSVNTCNYCGKDWVSKVEPKTTATDTNHDLSNNEYINETLDENKEEIYDYKDDNYVDIPSYPYKWLIVYENGDTEKIRACSISEILRSNSLSYSQFYITNIIRL